MNTPTDQVDALMEQAEHYAAHCVGDEANQTAMSRACRLSAKQRLREAIAATLSPSNPAPVALSDERIVKIAHGIGLRGYPSAFTRLARAILAEAASPTERRCAECYNSDGHYEGCTRNFIPSAPAASSASAVPQATDPFQRGKELREQIERLDAERKRLFDEYCSLPPFKAGEVDAEDMAWATDPLSGSRIVAETAVPQPDASWPAGAACTATAKFELHARPAAAPQQPKDPSQ